MSEKLYILRYTFVKVPQLSAFIYGDLIVDKKGDVGLLYIHLSLVLRRHRQGKLHNAHITISL